MEKFILPFLYSLAVSVLAIPILLWFGKKFQIKNIQRFGGVLIILIFIFSVFFNRYLVITSPIAGIIIGSVMILIFGFWDDLKNLNWKKQLIFQALVALVAIIFGVRSYYFTSPFGGIINLQNPVIYFALFISYYLLFINSINWFDGIDGLSGSVVLVGLLAIFFLSFKPEVNQPATAILCSIAAGAVVGFLIYNWKPSKILAGTAGAWFFGFLLASLSIFAGAKVATVLIVSMVPILDLVSVIRERYSSGKSVFSGNDDRHLQFRLLKLGLTEVEIILLICGLSALIGIIALNISAFGKLLFIFIFAAIYFVLTKMLRLKCGIND
jgi:UDP-GlcNAc:undecaprenyl-phosphate/decaprenyl-phosphate GlcNAc-1-phosphate transferase